MPPTSPRAALCAVTDKQAECVKYLTAGVPISLLLFDYAYAGVPRSRGQSMVDLLSQYETVGLQLNCRELPWIICRSI